MAVNSDYLSKLKEKEKSLLEKIAATRLKFGESDGAMQSRYSTGRSELETELSLYENQLGVVRRQLREAENPSSEQPGEAVVRVGSRVTLEINGDPTEYLLAEPLGDTDVKTLSPNSPVGKAVVGKKVGETGVVLIPSGEVAFKILEVK